MVATGALLLAACGPTGFSEAAAAPKIGFILIGRSDDLGYNQAVHEGSVAVARAFPDNEVIRTFGVPETTEAVDAMERLIAQGATVVFATSFGHRDAAVEVARRHPDVIVVHQGGVETENENLENFGTYFGTMYEPVYQAGIAAGAESRSGQLGFVAAFPIPATYNNVNAFTLGARSVNPDATTTVVFTDAWCDPARQAAAAATLIDGGVDVLGQHQDCTGTVLAAAETAGVSSVGYHYDASESAPNGWLVGAVWNWEDLFVDITRVALDGTFAESPYNGNFRGGLHSGDNPFVLTEAGPAMEPPALRAIEAAAIRLAAGATPFDGPLDDRDGHQRVPARTSPTRADIDSMDYFVPGVVGGP